MRARRAITALTIPLMALVGLTACQSGEGSSPADASAPAAEVVPAVDLLTVQDLDARMRSASQAAHSARMSMTMTGEGLDMTTQSEFVLDGEAVGLHQVIDVAGETMEMTVVDGLVYMNMGEATGGLFVVLDPATDADLMGGSLEAFTGQVDPAAMFAGAEDVMVSFEADGDPVELDGVQTQPYVAVIDTAKALEASSALLPAGADSADVAAAMPAQLTYHLWLGVEDDLLRKMTFEMQGLSMEALYTGWGSDIQITAPPADQITDLGM